MILMKYDYSTDMKGPRAMGSSLRISPKRAKEVADAIRGMDLVRAKRYLEDVAAMKTAVPYNRYKHKLGHRKGMCTGGYPIRIAEHFLKVLKNAEANAKSDVSKLVVTHISANRGRPMPGRYKGSPSNRQTTHLQIILSEK